MVKIIFLLATLVAGIIFFSFQCDYMTFLSQGDHGRDFYSFKKTSEGALPYKDYWSTNGPLMPYYHASFYHIFGTTLQTTLLAHNLLAICLGILVYLCCSCFASPAISFICAMWYWLIRGNGFFYTFNHIGALFLLLLVIYCLFRNIKGQKESCSYINLLFTVSLSLLKSLLQLYTDPLP
jgi:hypothetical protein